MKEYILHYILYDPFLKKKILFILLLYKASVWKMLKILAYLQFQLIFTIIYGSYCIIQLTFTFIYSTFNKKFSVSIK